MTRYDPKKPMTYQIQVQGNLDDSWSDWIGGMTAEIEDGITTLTGTVADQAALRGMLGKLWDLNTTLISARILEVKPKQED